MILASTSSSRLGRVRANRFHFCTSSFASFALISKEAFGSLLLLFRLLRLLRSLVSSLDFTPPPPPLVCIRCIPFLLEYPLRQTLSLYDILKGCVMCFIVASHVVPCSSSPLSHNHISPFDRRGNPACTSQLSPNQSRSFLHLALAFSLSHLSQLSQLLTPGCLRRKRQPKSELFGQPAAGEIESRDSDNNCSLVSG